MTTLDHRAENEVLWRYPERIRQVDAMCDEAELRGIADAPPELASLGIGLGWTLWLLEKARLGELEDREPTIPLCYADTSDPSDTAEDAADTLDAIAELLHDHAQLRRRGTA
jgi:hypothetical protein